MRQLPKYLKIILKLLAMECRSHDSCVDGECPLSRGNKCRVTEDIPCYWEVEE